MRRQRTRIEQSARLHRHAAAAVAASSALLSSYNPATAATDFHAEQRDLAARLRTGAARLTPGWLGAQLDAVTETTPLGGPALPTFVRVGQAQPLDDAQFPVVVPLLRAGHVAIDADARDPRVAGLLRALLLRLLAASPPGAIHPRIVDSAAVGATFGAFHRAPLPPAVTDVDGLRELLTEAEQWVAGRVGDQPLPAILLVIASLPELTEGSDLARIAALAKAGPAGRLHIIAAGWPPPPLTAETTRPPLPYSTQITLRNPHVWIGDPPGTTFTAQGRPGRLGAPVYLDGDPPPRLIERVTERLAAAQPDPTANPSGVPAGTSPADPEHSAWGEYVTDAQRLDSSRLRASSAVAESTRTTTAARERLASVAARAQANRAALATTAQAAGRAAPILDADPAEVMAMTSATGTPPPTQANALLTAAETHLAGSAAALTPRRGRDKGPIVTPGPGPGPNRGLTTGQLPVLGRPSGVPGQPGGSQGPSSGKVDVTGGMRGPAGLRIPASVRGPAGLRIPVRGPVRPSSSGGIPNGVWIGCGLVLLLVVLGLGVIGAWALSMLW